MKMFISLHQLSSVRVVFLLMLLWLQGGSWARAQPYQAGDVVTTNFALPNRLRWTNDNGQIFAPADTLHLSDFEGKIVFFMFFDVW